MRCMIRFQHHRGARSFQAFVRTSLCDGHNRSPIPHFELKLGFTRTFHRNQYVTANLKFEFIFTKISAVFQYHCWSKFVTRKKKLNLMYHLLTLSRHFFDSESITGSSWFQRNIRIKPHFITQSHIRNRVKVCQKFLRTSPHELIRIGAPAYIVACDTP